MFPTGNNGKEPRGDTLTYQQWLSTYNFDSTWMVTCTPFGTQKKPPRAQNQNWRQ